MVNFLKVLTRDAPELAGEGKFWGVSSEFKASLMFPVSHCQGVCNIVLYSQLRYIQTPLFDVVV